MLGEYEGYLKAGFGSYGRKETTGAVIPIGEDAAFRVSGYLRERDGFVDNTCAIMIPFQVQSPMQAFRSLEMTKMLVSVRHSALSRQKILPLI